MDNNKENFDCDDAEDIGNGINLLGAIFAGIGMAIVAGVNLIRLVSGDKDNDS